MTAATHPTEPARSARDAERDEILRVWLATSATYCPTTGLFKSHLARSGGRVVGFANDKGYTVLVISGRRCLAHRVAWFAHYGEWPAHDIDHINGDKADNRLENLRHVVSEVNRQNQRCARRDNKLGLLGVCRHRRKFLAQIQVKGKKLKLGLYHTPEAAHERYLEFKRLLHEGCTI